MLIRSVSRNFGLWLALVLAVALQAGCGGGDSAEITGSGSNPAPANNARALRMTLDFGGQARVLPRLVSGATYRLTIGEYPAGTVLSQREGSAAGGTVTVEVNVTSSSQIFVRLEVFDQQGNIVGWFDRLAEGTNPNLTFDTLILGPCPDLSDIFSQPRLAFRQQPGNVPSGQNLAFEVVALDRFGQVDTASNSTATLSATSPITLSNTQFSLGGGSASPSVVVTGAAVGVVLRVEASGYVAASSDDFEVLAAEPNASRLRFLEPLTTELPVLTPLLPSIQVELVDAEGNRVVQTEGTVTLSFNPQPNPGTALFTITTDQSAQVSTLSAPVINGVATFFNVAITRVGAYRLRASLSNFADGISPLIQVFAVPAGPGGGAAAPRLLLYGDEPRIFGYTPPPATAVAAGTPNSSLGTNGNFLRQMAVDDARNIVYFNAGTSVHAPVFLSTENRTLGGGERSFSSGDIVNSGGLAYDPGTDTLFLAVSPPGGVDDRILVFLNASTRNTNAEAVSFTHTGITSNINSLAFGNGRLYVGISNGTTSIAVYDTPTDGASATPRIFGTAAMSNVRDVYFGNGKIYAGCSNRRIFSFTDQGPGVTVGAVASATNLLHLGSISNIAVNNDHLFVTTANESPEDGLYRYLPDDSGDAVPPQFGRTTGSDFFLEDLFIDPGAL